ncbi:S41 family peptidase [Streptococcus merionis]|uniref:S41 family peptidase n=1 Tax=Streptococcus merionis TaxID=400065 RepID=A0A239T2E1_9STRE|nr:S41 family peptidase [Streptococcus merionis]
MTKQAIFDQVVSLLQNDSATKKDLTGADPALFREKITEEMSDEDFLYVMRCYLASFGVISHVSFHPKKPEKLGFRLRIYDNRLFVVQADEQTGLREGDEIVTISGQTVKDFYQTHQAYFVSQTPERHYADWARLMKRYPQLTVARESVILQIRLQDPSDAPDNGFSGYLVNDETYYMRLIDFSNEAAITELYKQAFPILSGVKNLIIDVRVNHGGTDSLYFPLFPYTLPEGKGFKDLEKVDDDGMEILYTPTNVQHRLDQFAGFLANPDISKESKQMIANFTKELKANADKGFLVYDDASDEDDGESMLSGYRGLAESPERIIILSDVYCGSSGDNFVEMMRRMPKVTVVGRPTLGILDYSNCCTVDFGDFELLYPTSRSLAIDHGKGMTDKGVLPDVLVPWTPDHLLEDMDMKVAMEVLKGEA